MTVISAMKKMPARFYSFVPRFLPLVLLSVQLVVLYFPSFANAQSPSPTGVAMATTCSPDQTLTEVGCLPTDPIQFVASFYSIGLGLIGGVALLFIIIGGYNILTSRGNPEQVNVGKSYIFYSILGLLLAIFGYFFIEVFLVDILHLPGFSH